MGAKRMICKWLPDLYLEPDWNNFQSYIDELYDLYCYEYLDIHHFFRGKKVSLRRQPEIDGKHNTFYHFICKNIDRDEPTKDRIQRILWTKAFFYNYDCQESCCNKKPLCWIKKFKGNDRYKIYFQDYLVILEERKNYFLLITGYYVDDYYYHKGLLKEYEKQKAKARTF